MPDAVNYGCHCKGVLDCWESMPMYLYRESRSDDNEAEEER